MSDAAFAAQPWDSAFQPGMSLRDWFAGQALAAMQDLRDEGDWSEYDEKTGRPRENAEWIAIACYRYADALLAHRQLPTEN